MPVRHPVRIVITTKVKIEKQLRPTTHPTFQDLSSDHIISDFDRFLCTGMANTAMHISTGG
jgi:hypothetical protein